MDSPVASKQKLGFIKRDVPLSGFTTWNVGGASRFFCQPGSLDQIRAAIDFANRLDLEILLIGNGSNLLVPDRGFDGLAIRLGPDFGALEKDGPLLRASGGTSLYKLADSANESGSDCFNFLTGIPGTVGGGLAMNAGAFGWSISDYLNKFSYADLRGEVHERRRTDQSFGYRTSPFQRGSDKILLEAEFELDYEVDQPDMGEILEIRREKLPYSYPSAGSVFKNPPGLDSSAGELLDEVGAKGLTVGGATVSHQHANFILNKGQATAKNIRKTIDILRDRVYKEFGVTLVTEVTVI